MVFSTKFRQQQWLHTLAFLNIYRITDRGYFGSYRMWSSRLTAVTLAWLEWDLLRRAQLYCQFQDYSPNINTLVKCCIQGYILWSLGKILTPAPLVLKKLFPVFLRTFLAYINQGNKIKIISLLYAFSIILSSLFPFPHSSL